MNDWPVMLQVAVTGLLLVVCSGLILGALVVPWALSFIDKLSRLVEDE